MDAKELTFGCEIETLVPRRLLNEGLAIGGYYGQGTQVPYLPDGWRAKNDGSVRSTNNNLVACEIVSPILKGSEGLAQVHEVLQTLESKGHTVNASCGVHVHIGWLPSWLAQSLARLITVVAYLEKGLYAITGTKARELGSYCKPVRHWGDDKRAKTWLEDDRYHLLNLKNLATGSKNTVEFRCFSGSINPVKVIGWIQVCLGIVERAINGKRGPSWNPKPLKGGWKKAGEGQSETERLLGYLAWADATAKLKGGKMYGLIYTGIPRETIKAELRRLSRKYDNGGQEP